MAASQQAVAKAAEQQQKQAQQEEARQGMLMNILTQEAKERLNRIAIVKPDKARAVENRLLQMARGGKLKDKITDEALTGLLESLSGKEAQTKVVMKRRTYFEESDEDSDGDL